MRKLKFNFKPPSSIGRRFRSFKKVIVKSQYGLRTLVAKNSSLKKTLHTLFSKKGLTAAAVGTVATLGINSIWNYIESNSGCFLKRIDGSICKVREFSCCQKEALDNVPFCDGAQALRSICDDFDGEKEDSCCRMCDCKTSGLCSLGETMQCQRPTVADALTHFAGELGSTLQSGIGLLFPWASYIYYGIAILFIFWIWNVMPRWWKNKNKKDV